VTPGNADAIALQWAFLHGLDPKPGRADRVHNFPRRAWLGADGKPLIEQYVITGMAHGIPLDAAGSGEGLGEAGAHMLDVGLSSTELIAAFFGIAPQPAERTAHRTHAPRRAHAAAAPAAANGVQELIEKSLRAAGLMR
jgi:poly(3-hydroxybutyrate) depolymerase